MAPLLLNQGEDRIVELMLDRAPGSGEKKLLPLLAVGDPTP